VQQRVARCIYQREAGEGCWRAAARSRAAVITRSVEKRGWARRLELGSHECVPEIRSREVSQI
jgi:hypothetical protein